MKNNSSDMWQPLHTFFCFCVSKYSLTAVLLFLCMLIPSILTAGVHDPVIELAKEGKGISSLVFRGYDKERNYIDINRYLGDISLVYQTGGKQFAVELNTVNPQVLKNEQQQIHLYWQLPGNVRLYQLFRVENDELYWDIELVNRGDKELTVTDLSLPVPIGGINRSLKASQNLNRHISLNGDASFIYWSPFTGQGNNLLMTLAAGTSLEYETRDGLYFIHSQTSVDRENDTWRFPSSSRMIPPRQKTTYGFRLCLSGDREQTREAIYNKGGMITRVVPGMVIPAGTDIQCALRSKENIMAVIPEFEKETDIRFHSKDGKDHAIYTFRFTKPGENKLTVTYGDGKQCYLEFFVTQPIETLIKKRSRFIVEKQQHRDPSKWYNGLYSLWDMEKQELLSPDHLGDLQEDFMVGGSDDPSNSKPMYVSEKNTIYPDDKEIESLEYYQEHFVWGKLQRTDKEYPYPYGIYGSENWYQNRSGEYGGYEDGGAGKGRMWRTFDYTTHFAIYYNLYRIARDYPEKVKYLNADGYLERAYRTAMAYFEVPYNILMGKQWDFNGWTDWAYKQGNFHERYLLNIIEAMEENGRLQEAGLLRREWEKKVTYMVYEDPWPFGSEMFVDRTAFESSYYVAEYAKQNNIEPQEQFWYDKNKMKWYSYTEFDRSLIDRFMQNQLDGNLALRGIFEPGFYNLGTAWTGQGVTLEYMTQMGGVALLDYGLKFSDDPATYINYGYNSLWASWALMNSGNAKDNYGYWYPGQQNDGAVGWAFSPYQNSHTYMRYIQVGRKPWRYDGEIDHGLTGGLHGSGVYILTDPVFGKVCYGGKLLDGKGNTIRFIPEDGIRRQICLVDENRFTMRLVQDGLLKNSEVSVKKDLSSVQFTVENRAGKDHTCIILFTHLPEGIYRLQAGSKEMDTFEVKKGVNKIGVPVAGKQQVITINKINK